MNEEIKIPEFPKKLRVMANRLWGCRKMQEDDFRFEAEVALQEAFLEGYASDKVKNESK